MNLDRIIAVRTNKTIYRDGDRCLKVFCESCNKSDIFGEALNQTRAGETGLPVPQVLEVTTIESKWAIVSEYIKGKTLAQLMEEHPESKEAYLNQFVDIQLSIREKTCPLLIRLKDKMNRMICDTDLPATVRFDLHARVDDMPRHYKLCHGDFNPTNIVVTPDGTPYILDWAQATQGNAGADAARTYLLFWLDGDISGAERYLELFCEKSDTAMQYVQKWMPIVAASQTVKGNEKEREFLNSWIDVVDYE